MPADRPAFSADVRVHVALTTADLAASLRFFEALLGAPPDKRRPGWARFLTGRPALALTLTERPGPTSAHDDGVSHLGLRVAGLVEVERAAGRLRAAGAACETRTAEACCHARQDKLWTTDPDGRRWEVYVVTDDDLRACCGDGVETRVKVVGCCEESAATCCDENAGDPASREERP